MRSQTSCHFYPRPPRGGRRCGAACFHLPDMISIHALRAEGDLDSDIAQIIYKISIPALREEGDQRQPCIVAKLLYFYPRPPRGGRPSGGFAMGYVTKFLSTPSARRATPDSAGDHPDQRFLSTPSARRATRSRGSLQRFRIFLSTPSARRATSQAYFSFRRCIISIHALREEGDVTDLGQIKLPYRISIHALREEGDPLPCCRGFMLPDFYPRPPRGGRRARWNPLVLIPVFLSTPSARRATAIDVSGQIGRQISIHALREEGDLTSMVSGYVEPLISIHTLREEGDVSPESLSAAS